jgi:hypothetical protein
MEHVNAMSEVSTDANNAPIETIHLLTVQLKA